MQSITGRDNLVKTRIFTSSTDTWSPWVISGGSLKPIAIESVGNGDAVLALSGGSPGLLRGAADLVAQIHGTPADTVLSALQKAIRKSQGGDVQDVSVVYLRKT